MKIEKGLRILAAAAVINGAVACGSGKRDDETQVVPTAVMPAPVLVATATDYGVTVTPEAKQTESIRKPPTIEPTVEIVGTPTPPEVWPMETNTQIPTATPMEATSAPSPTVEVPTLTPTLPTSATAENRSEINTLGLENVDPLRPELKEQARAFYLEWKGRYVTNEGVEAGQLRAFDPNEEGKTRSEGMAYGLLLSVFNDEPETFDQLWLYTQKHFNGLGLMDWDIGANSEVVGAGSASDADLDMAYALLLANSKWGGYETEARQLLAAIWENDVEKDTLVLKPGGHWGGSKVTNPSYFALGYMSAFAKADPEHDWSGVGVKMAEILEKIKEKTGKRVFVPDWCDAEGNLVEGMSYDHTYDATRIGWRLAQGAIIEAGGTAQKWSEEIASYFRLNPPGTLVDGYKLDGTPIGQWHNNAFVAPVYAAMEVTNNPRADEYRQEMIRIFGDRYYQDSLATLAMWTMAGGMVR